jgi:hypothetical protein
MKDLKLYYWDEVLTNYTAGCAVVLASNAEEARRMVIEKYAKNNPDWVEEYWGPYVRLLEEINAEPKVYDVNTKNVFYCEGGA